MLIEPNERVPHSLPVRGRDSGALVLDRNLNIRANQVGADGDGLLVRAVPGGIVEEVEKDLANRQYTIKGVRMISRFMVGLGLAILPVSTVLAQGTSGAPNTIVDVAIGAGKFKTLVAALQAAGLVETLKGAGPFTVFAPTDEAFAKLPPGTVEALLKDKAKLTAILTYHVVSGAVGSDKVVKLKSAKTVNGKELSIMVMDGKVMVGNAHVTATDIKASNGLIHVIDAVLLP